MAEYSYELKIPKERIAVLIGKCGEVKNDLEEITGTRIDVDSEEGDVVIKGEDPLKLLSAREIVTAIARGFNPDVAKLLLKQDYCIEIVSLSNLSGTKNDMIRLKGRVIGSEGKSRKQIEQMTDTDICVFGKTIGIVGEANNVSIARRAIESLLKGSQHAKVYKMLEKSKREFKKIGL